MRPYTDSYIHGKGGNMAATVINYLYEDLPDGYTVLAEDWNTAMRLIKDTINSHARIIDSNENKAVDFVTTIGTSLRPWTRGASDQIYSCSITAAMHNKGIHPHIMTYTTSGEIVHCAYSIDLNIGNVTFESNVDIPINVVIR